MRILAVWGTAALLLISTMTSAGAAVDTAAGRFGWRETDPAGLRRVRLRLRAASRRA